MAETARADLPQLAEEAELTDHDLLPLAQALALFGFAQLADADLHLTELGRRYVDGAHTLRQQLLGQQLLAHVPLAAHIRHSLEQAPSGELPQEPFLELLMESLDETTAERVLRTGDRMGTLWRGVRIRPAHRPHPSARWRGRGG